MSRTDKDTPWWVQAEWYEPSHDHHCVNNNGRTRWPGTKPCTLPATVKRHGPIYGGWIAARKVGNYCTWEPVWPRKDRYNYTRPPTRRERHLDWWGPARAKDRDAGRRARQEHRGGGDYTEPKVFANHRHCSITGWWG